MSICSCSLSEMESSTMSEDKTFSPLEEEFQRVASYSWKTSILVAKARVTPTKGITAPRSELNGMVVMSRLISIVTKSMPEKPCRITMIGDSECTIAALENQTANLASYFANRIMEVEDKMKSWGVKVPEENCLLDTEEEILMGDYPTEVDPVFHIAGTDNVADLATRGAASVRSISSGSVWQDGPSYLQGSRKFWPISRQFLRQIPTE